MVFDIQLIPPRPLRPRVPVRSGLGDGDLSAKSRPPPACPGCGLGRGGGPGFPGTRSSPRFSPDLSKGGTESPGPGAGLPGVRTRGAGRTGCGSGRLRLAPRPAAARTLASPSPQRASTPRWASVGRGLSRVLRGPLESLLAQSREKARSQSGQKVPFLRGASPGQAPSRWSRAARAPPLSRWLFHSLSALVEGGLSRQVPPKGNASPGPGCQGPKD